MVLLDSRAQASQWDYGLSVLFSADDAIVDGQEIHFAAQGDGVALVVRAKSTEDGIIADVPNQLLTDSRTLRIYAYVDDGEHGRTVKRWQLPVFARPKPDDYVYTETEVFSYKTLDARIAAVETANTVIQAEVESHDERIEALEQGGGGAVKSVNGQTGAVVLGAADVGALPADTPIPGAYDDTEIRSLISGKYTKPSGGIPKTDLASAVKTSLGKADTALQALPEHTHPTAEVTGLEGELSELKESIETKQDTLTAGTNITISEDNVISATGGGGTTVEPYDDTEIREELDSKQSKTLVVNTEITSQYDYENGLRAEGTTDKTVEEIAEYVSLGADVVLYVGGARLNLLGVTSDFAQFHTVAYIGGELSSAHAIVRSDGALSIFEAYSESHDVVKTQYFEESMGTKQDKILIVNVTDIDETYVEVSPNLSHREGTADKTFSDLKEAIDAGVEVYCRYYGSRLLLTSIASARIEFEENSIFIDTDGATIINKTVVGIDSANQVDVTFTSANSLPQDSVYTKSEIDSMIGGIDAALNALDEVIGL